MARPDLIGKPIVVLSNNDGCVVARSREAKAAGVPMGEPEFKIRSLLEKLGVTVFSSNYTLYGDLSHRVMSVISGMAPKVEVYSIDEAFAILPRALALQADEFAREIRSRIWRWIGLPVSVGVAPTKTLAKIAVTVAKKYRAYGGVFNLAASRKIPEILKSVRIGDVWGIGRSGAFKLRSAGIYDALAFSRAKPDFVRKILTVTGLNTWLELNGTPAVAEEIPASHSIIISSRSLGRKVENLEWMGEAAAYHAARAAEKLRQKKLLAGMVWTRVQTARYETDKPQHDEMAMTRPPRPTDDTAAIITAARRGLERIFKYGYAYAKVMVALTDLVDPARLQFPLIRDKKSAEAEERRAALMELMDKINGIEGRGTLRFAAQGQPDAPWRMNRARLSPAWTTDIKNLLRVGG